MRYDRVLLAAAVALCSASGVARSETIDEQSRFALSHTYREPTTAIRCRVYRFSTRYDDRSDCPEPPSVPEPTTGESRCRVIWPPIDDANPDGIGPRQRNRAPWGECCDPNSAGVC